ncbi:hypothetical protein CSA37_02820 [Candidatus Fermentibacteria bacterium]|nr:MAG: hypothetical protein CSA37_02820 [Candidatus Fermentibacteria bacterium]
MYTAPVFLLSDFGHDDAYVAQMKASVIKVTGTEVLLVDICHTVPAGDILSGAFHLKSSLEHLPEGSVVLAVVDPGVGSSRAGLAARWKGRYVIAPDNGLISLMGTLDDCRKLPEAPEGSSSTFHGRDLFAICAAYAAVDPDWMQTLKKLEEPVKLSFLKNTVSDNAIETTVLHVDHFGNCILNIPDSHREITGVYDRAFSAACDSSLIHTDHYQQGDAKELMLLAGSQGYLELALNGGSAGAFMGIRAGDRVTLSSEKGGLQ